MFDQNRIHGAELSIADKIEAIERSKDLGELPAKFWPDSHSEKYLFINSAFVLQLFPAFRHCSFVHFIISLSHFL